MRRTLLLPLLLLVLAAAAFLVWRPWAPAHRDGAGSAVRTIVLITPDTLRRDRVGVYGRNTLTRTPLTPRMDELAGDGLRFEDGRAPVPLTLPSHTTMLTGLPPAVTGVRLNAYGRLPPSAERGFPLLQEKLRDAGWHTGAFVSAAALLALHGLDQGFDVYDDRGLDERPPGLTYAERAGEETVEHALGWVGALPASDPVFLWVHLFEPHAPYAPGQPATLPEEVRYDIDVARCDRIVGTLLDGLRDLGRGDAAVLLVADHGEALEELGERTHGYLLGDAVLRVPFLLRAPGVAPGVRDDPVDVADVAPTLAGLAGLEWPQEGPAVPGRGEDILAGEVPPGRHRVAESLFAHQRYGWAQLVGAVDGAGNMLVDAGGERQLWLEPAPPFEPQVAPGRAQGVPAARSLAETLRAYRGGERADRMQGGGVAGGYGSGAVVGPFLPPQENGRLPDPYGAIPRVYALDRLSFELREGLAQPRVILARLKAMEADDPRNPEIAYWRGRAHETRAARDTDPAVAAAARRAAAAAFLEAWRRGRRDANTLGLAVGVDAHDREAAALKMLRALALEIPADGRLTLLEARLARAAGRDDEADASCTRAETLCRRPWERRAWVRESEEGACRSTR